MRRLVPVVLAACSAGSTVLALAACQPSDDLAIAGPAPIPPAPALPVVEPIAKGTPHGAQIERAAITEEADAAITFDLIGGVRLWPSLDGTRPPIAIATDAPNDLALVHAGRDLVAVIRDDAGGVRLLRLGLDGTIRGRVTLPGQYLQAVALDKGVVVRGADHAVEWYSHDGVLRGRVMADAGQQVHSLATRRGHAVAIVGDAKRGVANTLRYLVLADALTWSAPIALPGALLKPHLFALSPSHERIAYLDSAGRLAVYDVGERLEAHAGNPITASDAVTLGFLDDNQVAVASPHVTHLWTGTPAGDPWASSTSLPTPTQTNFGATDIAIGDGLVVRGATGSLALVGRSRVRYLGYKDLAAGQLIPAGAQFALTVTNSRFVWLDGNLEVQRDVTLRENKSGWMYGTPIGERHVVTQTSNNGKYEVALVDVTKPDAPISLGHYATIDRLEYAPDIRLLAIATPGKVDRYRLDLATNQVEKLARLAVRGSPNTVRLFDPDRADGLVAITTGWDNDWADEPTLAAYTKKGKKIVRTKLRALGGQLLQVDATGAMFLYDHGEKPAVVVRRGNEQVSRVELPDPSAGRVVAVTDAGDRIAYVAGTEIVLVDGAGKESWRQPLWGAGQLVFTPDGKRLLVRATGGFVALDTATGVRVAMECGWGFGLHDTVPSSSVMHQAPVCEDPTLQ